MLWIVLAVVLALWLLGWTVANLGNVVHLLLVVALAVVVIQHVRDRGTA